MSHRHLRSVLLIASSMITVSVIDAAPSAAAQPDREVDQSQLEPPPPAFFNSTCVRTGGHISCDLAFVDPISPVEEPTGIICGSGADQFEILDTWTRSVRGTRRYSADGLLLRRHFNDVWQGTFTNSETGATVDYSQRTSYLHDLVVPGDSGTGFERTTIRVRAVDTSGTVLIEAGRFVLSRDEDEIVFQAGPHPFTDYFFGGDPAGLQPVCDALAS